VRVESELNGVRVPSALPERTRLPLFVVAALGAVTVAVLGVLYAGDIVGTAFDIAVRESLLGLGSPWRQIALIIDYTAEPVGAVIMFTTLVVVFLKMGHRRAALFVLAGPGATVVVTTLLKPLVGRDINQGFLAFPSGHTATATGVTLIVMLVVVERTGRGGFWLIAAVTTAAALAMAWAQVLLNAHYPTDTIGGYATALAVIPPVGYAIDRLTAWRSGSTRTGDPTRSPAPTPPPPDADHTA
jgi:undecaprenyl-diphosphatase